MIFIGYYEIDSRWLKVKVNYMFIHGNEKVQNVKFELNLQVYQWPWPFAVNSPSLKAKKHSQIQWINQLDKFSISHTL